MTKYLKTPAGEQVVVIDSRYAFAWDGEVELELGERVVLPGFQPDSHWRGTVTDFGTDFPGILKKVIERVVPLKTGHFKINVKDAKKMRLAYESGKSIRFLADVYGVSFGGARSALLRAGTTLRRKGGWSR